ncbi:hypothetical protein CCMA1212_009239 [Trichoderma ghanense]|uniref:Uncharacterized protein n=1 Tax=Trichoderma ghanense TaxID=65468 RepID=A0ABY2GTX0_9HYPO
MAYDGGVCGHIGSIRWQSIGNRHTKVVGAGFGREQKVHLHAVQLFFPMHAVELPSQETLDPDRLSFALSFCSTSLAYCPSSRFSPRKGQRAKSRRVVIPLQLLPLGIRFLFFFQFRHVSDSPAGKSTSTLSPRAGACPSQNDADDGLSLSRVVIDRSTSIPVSFSAEHPRYLHCGPKCLPRHFARGHASWFIDRVGARAMA